MLISLRLIIMSVQCADKHLYYFKLILHCTIIRSIFAINNTYVLFKSLLFQTREFIETNTNVEAPSCIFKNSPRCDNCLAPGSIPSRFLTLWKKIVEAPFEKSRLDTKRVLRIFSRKILVNFWRISIWHSLL